MTLRTVIRRAGLLAVLALGSCRAAVLDPVGPVSGGEKQILIDSVAIMLAIVVPTIAATLGVAWWFRASNARARYLPDWAFSGRLELLVWSIPLLTITLLGGVAWIGSHELDPAEKLLPEAHALEVQVVSLDWKWLFVYPEQHVASLNMLALPAGRPVHFTLTSSSVMNTFWVPRLGGMIYTMNAMRQQLWLRADRPGTYLGGSGHFSGDGFSGMHFDVRAMPAADFAGWVAEAQGAGETLDDGGYAALARQSQGDPPRTWRDVSPGLFDRVVSQQLAPGPGPQPEASPHSKARGGA